jgi:hypothetical protein
VSTMKKLLIALVLFAAIFAVGIEETVAGYYAANQEEDIEKFMGHVDTSGLSEPEIEFEREMVLGVWEAYNTDEYRILGLEYTLDDSGEYAMAGYALNATISGAENFNYELDYVMLLHLVGGSWKVSYVMPYEEYLDIGEQGRGLMAIDYLAEEEYGLGSKPIEPAEPTFDGLPPRDLSSEIDSASGNSAVAQTGCRDTRDCAWNENCENGFCVPASGKDCGTAFVLIALAGALFAGRGFAF